MLLLDIPAEIQIPGEYILESMQFKSRGYDSHFKLFFGRYSFRPQASGLPADVWYLPQIM